VFALVAPSRLRDVSARTVRQTALAPLIEIERRAATVRAAIAARDSMLVVRGRLATDALSVSAVAEENAQLRRLLGLASRLREGYVVAEVITARGRDDPFTLVLSAGSAAGVEPLTPVVTADGLLGMVHTVDGSTSFAITWANADFRVSAMSVDEQALGIVQPHLGTGVERWLLEMRGVAFRAKLDSGALIVSAGLGSTHPRGIPIGTVIGEIATTEKWARTYLLRPAVLPAAIGPVMILLPSKRAEGVSRVWATIGSSDSAARAIAIAGDSIARRTALDELEARRLAIDSTTADSLTRDSLARPLQRPMPGEARSAAADSARRDSIRLRLQQDSARARARADSLRRVGPPPPLPRTGPPPPELP
jgi:rod shape-determining protein MreC